MKSVPESGVVGGAGVVVVDVLPLEVVYSSYLAVVEDGFCCTTVGRLGRFLRLVDGLLVVTTGTGFFGAAVGLVSKKFPELWTRI